MNKVVLGTAQFGMDYGINNKKGKIPQEEAFQIIEKSLSCGIEIFDTAYGYGESEKILGDFIRGTNRKIKVVSKLPACKSPQVWALAETSLAHLRDSEMYGYLVHDFESYRRDTGIWDKLQKLKKAGKIRNIGFSLYFPAELEMIFKHNLQPDIIQIPFNVFDRRFDEYLGELKKRDVQIFARSVFLQGMIFRDPVDLPASFAAMADKISQLHSLSAQSGIPVFALCLNFVVLHEAIDRVVVGVDSLVQLQEIFTAFEYTRAVKDSLTALAQLGIEDEEMVLPFHWARHGVKAEWIK